MFAISYDSPIHVKAFADAHRISYPLLADEGSRVIRALGVLDTELEAHQAVFGVPTRPEQLGVAYPMTFILDGAGRVERKIVEANYRLRYSASWLVHELIGGTARDIGRPIESAASGPLAIVSGRARLDAPAYFPYQRSILHVGLSISPGWHVYAPGSPGGYAELAIDVESAPEGVRSGPIAWPPPAPFRFGGLDEPFAVYTGTVAVDVPLEFIVPRGSGSIRLQVGLTFQTCNDGECLPPNAMSLSLSVPEAPVPSSGATAPAAP